MNKPETRGGIPAVALTALIATTALGAAGNVAADEQHYGDVVVFGDSLIDPGNIYALTGEVAKKPYDLVPARPYTIGAFHFSNGETWVEQLSHWLGLGKSAGPAFKNEIGANNFAVGGSTARDGGSAVPASAQIALYMSRGESIAEDTLFVYGFGGNDIRQAGQSADPATVIQEAVYAMTNHLLTLCTNGARNVLVANTPNVSLAPAIQLTGDPIAIGGARLLAQSLNKGVAYSLATVVQPSCPNTKFMVLDTFALSSAISADPGGYGFDTTEACLNFGSTTNAVCEDPNAHFFWDGLHPTRSGHSVIASEALAVVTGD